MVFYRLQLYNIITVLNLVARRHYLKRRFGMLESVQVTFLKCQRPKLILVRKILFPSLILYIYNFENEKEILLNVAVMLCI